jgi:hypothetical protein
MPLCCSCRCLVVRLLSILAIAAGVAIVAWSTYDIWPLGFVLSILFASILWWSAHRYRKRLETENQSQVTENQEQPEAPAASNDAREKGDSVMTTRPFSYPVSLSLLYALAILCLGVPGAILTLNVLPGEEYYYAHGIEIYSGYWTTNEDELPSEVKKAHVVDDGFRESFRGVGSQFCQLGETMYFCGASAPDRFPYLYAISNNDTRPHVVRDPEVRSFLAPQWLTKVTQDALCFVVQTEPDRKYHVSDSTTMYCGNELTGFRPLVLDECDSISRLFGASNRLWFRCTTETFDAYAVMSLNITTMETTPHSERHEYSKKAPNEHKEAVRQDTMPHFVMGLFFTALPITVASLCAWAKWSVPSSSVTLFIGIGLIFFFFFGFLDPGYPLETASIGFMLWTVLGGFIWVHVCAFQIGVGTKAAKAPLVWSLNAISIVGCLYVLFCVVMDTWEAYSYSHSRAVLVEMNSIFVVVFLLLPSLLISIVVESALLLAIATFGITAVIVCNTALLVGPHVGLLVVLVVGEVGIMAAIVWLICRRKGQIRSKIIQWLRKCARYTCPVGDGNEDDTETTVELLMNEGAEPA